MKNLFRRMVMDVLPCKLWDIVLEEVGQTAVKFLHQQHIHNDCMTACGTKSVEKAQHEK